MPRIKADTSPSVVHKTIKIIVARLYLRRLQSHSPKVEYDAAMERPNVYTDETGTGLVARLG
jgi:hypothetical protein